MRIISKSRLADFWKLHPQSKTSLLTWFAIAEGATWNNLNEIKLTFPHIDYVGNDRYIFNVNGNKYRLIVMIFFDIQRIYIRFIGTHAEYDKVNARQI